MPAPAAETPLAALHRALGGKMVEFAGHLLPLSYRDGGLLAEHLHTRQAASLFDVSHMGQLQVGKSATAALAALVPADLAATASGEAKYTQFTNSSGGMIDDCIITNDGDKGWFIVVNAARKAADIDHLRAALPDGALTEHNSRALLAVQGPAAAAVVEELFPAAAALRFMQSVRADSPLGECRLSRCGYTGEDGFEISLPAASAEEAAKKILSSGICKPAGLGARDSLRLEAGLCLYGSELDSDTSPVEAGLLWSIPKSRRGADAGYPGAAAIGAQIAGGALRRLAALLPQGKIPVRQGTPLHHSGHPAGHITSGTHSPTLSAPIALARMDAAVPTDAELVASVRGREIACRQTALPFVAHRYHRGG